MLNMNGGSSTMTQVVRVSQESSPPVHVPVSYGGEHYIMTQQDVRKIKDVRKTSVRKLLPNGTTIPVNPLERTDGNIWGALGAACRNIAKPQENPAATVGWQDVNKIRDCGYDSKIRECGSDASHRTGINYAYDGYTPARPKVAAQAENQPHNPSLAALNHCATLQQQLLWARCSNSSCPPFPQRISKSTSTSEIPSTNVINKPKGARKCSLRRNRSRHVTFSRSVGTDGRDEEEATNVGLSVFEQLKIRKTKQNLM